MGELADRLARIIVEATSPDGRLLARVHGRLELELKFGPRAYRSYTESDLAHQLGRLATLTWTRYHREYLDVERDFLDSSTLGQDARDRTFEERAERLTVDGSSRAGRVRVRSRALVRWDFHLADGVLRQLTERRFAGETLDAVGDTILAYRAARARLLDEFYDLADGLPPWRRRRDNGSGSGRGDGSGFRTGRHIRTGRTVLS